LQYLVLVFLVLKAREFDSGIAELAWKAAHLGLTGRSVLCVALRANGYMAGIENHRPVVELEIEMVSSKVTRLGDRWILVRQVYYDRC
jgi:hypothetical protein